MTTSRLWALIEEWRDAQLFPVSQAALASKIGVTRSAMSQWKAGQAKPSPEKLRQIASVTRIPYQRLLSAVVQDMGYLDTKEAGGERADGSAPSRQAEGSSAADAGETPANDPNEWVDVIPEDDEPETAGARQGAGEAEG